MTKGNNSAIIRGVGDKLSDEILGASCGCECLSRI